jgi:hypothetical protein
MTDYVVLYHANCNDGFGAAWAIQPCISPPARFIAVSYDEPVPAAAKEPGVFVDIVDFSYPRAELVELCKTAKQVNVYDHHKTAQQALENWPDKPENLQVVFDMTKSGAVIVWEHFHTAPVPKLLQYVQDRDLWTWALPNSKEVNAVIELAVKTFAEWDGLARGFEQSLDTVVGVGKCLVEQESKLVDQHLTKAWPSEIDGHRALFVNATVHRSELGHRLLELSPNVEVAAIYWDEDATKRVVSLRSRKGGVDVSELAKKRGGGGHPSAAGYTVHIGRSPA